ncbi:exocyst complex subunit Sec15-like protein [Ceraceosorus guamensis]|uniref:Exocyst complex component SEC15 n=1 Tax=Ceraceosorus guamensis TaxID=1522189 RepID=A0A316VY32_9BASI|nr:exocyst complex subunit Sec15-like protein [Ceraceosorus guamensis]PWN42536.1 exocyst complex subunit Sec15-like protein [Ceraceosorus guamensis]
MPSAPRGRVRPHVSLDAQLQALTLFTDLDADSENLEQLGPIIKSLDEAGQSDAFLRRLHEFVKEKEDEIERICKGNHEDFVSATDRLLKVRSGTVSLRHRIGELNEEVKAGGESLSAKKKSLRETRQVGANLDEAIETLQLCLRVLDMTSRVEGLIENRRYYAALRSLEELQTVHLKPVLHHEFARHMLDSIPAMRDAVRSAVTSEMKEWLYEVRLKGGKVGKLALDAMEARQKRWRIKSSKDPMLSIAKVNSPIELVVNERVEYNFVDNEEVRIDFKPLYQCILIYDSMDMREQLQMSYQEDRRLQASLLLSQGLTFDPVNPTFPLVLQEVVGYFLVEHHVLQTSSPGFRSEAEVDDLWDNMCERVVDIVSVGLRDCRDTQVFVNTKAVIQTFIMTLEGCSFTVTKLNALLLTLFERYAQLLRDRFSADFQQAVKDAEHQPMVVEDADELNKVLNVCWLRAGEADKLRQRAFPLALPFSQTYPLCCMDIRHLVDEYYTFSDGFSQYHRDIDDILKKSLDELLIQQVSSSIRASVESTSNLSQIAQIVVNAEHFKLACTSLEGLLAALRAPHRGGRLRLDASSHFSHSLDLAQKRIDAALAAKLTEFIGMSEFEPTPAKEDTTEREWIGEMSRWIGTMMESVLVLLPTETKLLHYQSAYASIASVLLNEYVLDKDTPALNISALRNVLADVEALRKEASRIDKSIDKVFDEIRQTLSIPLNDAVSDYVGDARSRSSKYPAVQAVKLAGVLERLTKWHAGRGPSESDLMNRRSREKDMVGRLVRR